MLRRVLTEHRRFIAVLGVALLANLGIYAVVVYPLGVRVADWRRRAAQADESRRTAERDLAAAQAAAAGKDQAEAELATFYKTVLPVDLSAANRATYLSLEQLARKANLQITRRQASRTHDRGSALDRLQMSLVVEGTYESIRRLIHEIELARSFVVIDEMMIDQGRETTRPLVLTLSLSTYFRSSGDDS